MAASVKFGFLAVFAIFLQILTAEYVVPKKRFEYKHSFKGPHLVSKDGTIPFWEHGGHAIASDESVRVTPSLKSKKGSIWNKIENENKYWQADVKFRVTGRGRIGADGLAIWYTTERAKEGPVFGSKDQWNGLGIFLDSFDNDQLHNNPYIMAITNDGSKKYDHAADGSSQQLGGCMRDYRNKPFPVAARIIYYDNTLEVFFHSGVSNDQNEYELCLRAGGVILPDKGYFGVSAATGAIADDHDVISFLTHSLSAPPKDAPTGAAVSEDEKKKLEKEFDEYYDKLQKAKESYKKEHPEKQRQEDEEDDSKWFEDQKERELKQIFDGQSSMNNQLKTLQQKLDIIIGQNERTLSSLTSLSPSGGQVQHPGGGGGGGHVPAIDTMKRHEVDEVLRHLRDSANQVGSLRNLLDEVNTRTTRMNQQQGGQQQQQQQMGGGYDHEMKDHINYMRDQLTKIHQVTSARLPACPTVSCLSFSNFVVFALAQTIVLIGYMIYRSSKDAAAKKFY